MTTAQYQSLPDALRNLADAVHALTGPLNEVHTNRVVLTPSHYQQLLEAVSGEQSNRGGGTGSKSRPPCWFDALDLLTEIDTTIQAWTHTTGQHTTIARIHHLQHRRWRPQDCHSIQQISNILNEWTIEIDGLLNPPPTAYLMAPHSHSPAACTNCGTEWAYGIDHCGDLIRHPALQITAEGCHCQQCHTQWQPGQLQVLAAAIGYPLPTGLSA